MDEATLNALEASIRKWESDETPSGTIEDCALCKLFYPPILPPRDAPCAGCPVAAKSGKPYCRNTPFDDWVEAKESDDDEGAMIYQRRMASFLRSLHPNFDPDDEALRD
jgi:hypothetical protein